MGWNDHVELLETKCLDCGLVDIWEYWNEIALARYTGRMGALLGHDSDKHNRCPHCGSLKGRVIDDDDDEEE